MLPHTTHALREILRHPELPGNTVFEHCPGRLHWSATALRILATRQRVLDRQEFHVEALFPGGPGRTTRPEDFNSLMGGLEGKIFRPLPDNTWIYPGRGNDSTLGAERTHPEEWRARGW